LASPSIPLRQGGRELAYLGIVAAAAGWGTWGLLLRLAQAAGPVAPQLTALLVMSTIFVVLLPLALRTTRLSARRHGSREWALLVAFGLSDALNAVLYFAALQTTTVAVAVLTHYAAPLFVAVAAPLVLRERSHRHTLPAVLLGFAGLTLLLGPWQAHGPDARLLEGALLGVGSAVFYAANILFNKRLSESFEASEMLVYHMPSALLLLAFLVPAGAWVLPMAALPWLLLGALLPGVLGGVIFMRSLAQVPAAHASLLTLMEPVTALGIAALAWGEWPSAAGLVGAVAILGAGAWVVRGSG
jgi:drug/metabolite transporter (DMT)-like permease